MFGFIKTFFVSVGVMVASVFGVNQTGQIEIPLPTPLEVVAEESPAVSLAPISGPVIVSTQPAPTLAPEPVEVEITPENLVDEEGEFKEAKMLIDNFLSNPTLSNFEEFCRKGQNILSPKTEHVLNEERTDFVDKLMPLSLAIEHCEFVLNKNNSKNISFVEADENNLIPLKDGEGNSARETRINYNSKINEFNKKYKFYSYRAHENLSLVETIEEYLRQAESEDQVERLRGEQNLLGFGIYTTNSPEQRVREFVLEHF